jgi:hypothetical protein
MPGRRPRQVSSEMIESFNLTFIVIYSLDVITNFPNCTSTLINVDGKKPASSIHLPESVSFGRMEKPVLRLLLAT